MVPPDRPYKFTMMLSDVERAAAQQLAALSGLSVSDYIRANLLTEHAAMQAEAWRLRTDLVWLLSDTAQTTTDLMQELVGKYPADHNLGAKVSTVLDWLHRDGWASGSAPQGYKLTKRGENGRKDLK